MNRNIALQISTVVVTTACFAVMACTLLFSQNLRNILTLWGEDIQMTIYLAPDLSTAQLQNIETQLKAEPSVRNVRLVNQERALADFRSQLASYAPDLAKDDELLKLIPASYQLNLDSGLNSELQLQTLKQIAAKAHDIQGVEEVSYGQGWVEKYSSFVTAAQSVTHILAFVIVCAAIFVMSNVIRSLVHGHREEIEVLELVGATPFMIRKPFLLQGVWMGGISSLLALTLCFGVFQFLKSIFVHQLSFLRLSGQLQFITAAQLFLFIFGGMFLGAMASYMCVRKINDGWAASQRA